MPSFIVSQAEDGSWSTARVTESLIGSLGAVAPQRRAVDALHSLDALRPRSSVRKKSPSSLVDTIRAWSPVDAEIVVLDDNNDVAGLLVVTGDEAQPDDQSGVENVDFSVSGWGDDREIPPPLDPDDAGLDVPPSLFWITDLPRDDKALRRRLLFVGDLYRLVTRFSSEAPAPGDSAEVKPVAGSYIGRKVQFEILAEGAVIRRATDSLGDTETPFLDRVSSDPSVCEDGGTDPFAVDVRADRVGQARLELHVSVDGVPQDNAQLLVFAVVDPAAPPTQPQEAVAEVGRGFTTSLGPRSAAEEPVVHLKTTGTGTDLEGRAQFSWTRYSDADIDFVSVDAVHDLDVALRTARRELNALAQNYGKLGPNPADPLFLAQPDAAYLQAARIGRALHRALFGRAHDGKAPATTRECAELIANLGRSGSPVEPGRRMLIETPGAPFPWGLVFDGGYLDNADEPTAAADVDPEGFWGYRFTVDRMVRRYSPQGRGPALGAAKLSACTVVNTTIPPPVVDPEGRLTVMPEVLTQIAPITSATAFRAWLRQANGAPTDLLYFYCHAEAAQNVNDLGFFVNKTTQTQARLILDQSKAGVVTVADLEDGRPPAGGPVVFLTACAAGQGDISFASPFTTVFIQSWDGRSLVASDAEVPAIFGHAFAARVLATFLAGSRPIGQCLAETSRQLLDARNPFGLFFGLHGRPEVFRRKPS